ncbi:MAG: hypothetical protein LQ338_003692 [Usnochroma carphineum]|nr:MAG: hypothetical protein LQ338_003692 [Usnochroma carphineum]
MRHTLLPAQFIRTCRCGATDTVRILPRRRTYSTENPTSKDPNDLLTFEPTWSLRDLISPDPKSSAPNPTITPRELHHLLRLSALPLPKSPNEEQKMLKDLQSQLQFVRAIQNIDIPESVQPLQSIRDETEEAMREHEFTVESLAGEFGKEEVVGKRGRIRRRKRDEKEQRDGKGREEWNPWKLAPRTVGRYVAVDTARD